MNPHGIMGITALCDYPLGFKNKGVVTSAFSAVGYTYPVLPRFLNTSELNALFRFVDQATQIEILYRQL
jgi:hypothetical protein